MVGRSLATLVTSLPSFLLIYIKHLIDSTQYAREVLASLISSSFLPSQLFHCSIRRVPLFFLPTLPRRLMKAWRATRMPSSRHHFSCRRGGRSNSPVAGPRITGDDTTPKAPATQVWGAHHSVEHRRRRDTRAHHHGCPQMPRGKAPSKSTTSLLKCYVMWFDQVSRSISVDVIRRLTGKMPG